jgi:peroxiredoxin
MMKFSRTARAAITFVLSLTVVPTLFAEPTTQPAAPPMVGERAREFALKDLDGKSVTLAGMTQKGPFALIVLRGWPGYQCPFCTKQVAELRGKAEEFRKRGTPVLLVYPGPIERLDEHAREFLKMGGLPEGFRLATDPDYALVNAYGLRWDAPKETAYPSTFVIDAGQTVRFAKVSKEHGDRASSQEILKALDTAK